MYLSRKNILLTALAMLASAPAATAQSDASGVGDKETIVCYISWFSPVGRFNGTRVWGQQGYRYAGDIASDGVRNYPLPPDIDWPDVPPPIGSDAFYALQFDAALATQEQMLDGGFDVMIFDMLPMPEYDPALPLDEFNSPLAHFKTFLTWLEAAEDSGIKVGVMPDVANQSGDYPQRRTPTVEEWTRILTATLEELPDSPALWKIDDKPVLINFGTDSYYGGSAPAPEAPRPDRGWREIVQALRDTREPFYFIADIRPHASVWEWNGIADAAYMFAPASPDGGLVDAQRLFMRHLTIPYIWTVSPGYYRGGTAYTQPDFSRIHDTYMAAMREGAQRICVLTWNDFEENTDIAPSANKGNCLLDVFGFYNRWFKSGRQPELPEDQVILAYPVRIPDTVVSKSPAFGRLNNDMTPSGGTWNAPTYQPKVFYWAYVKEPTRLSVEGVGEVFFHKPGVWMGDLGCIVPGPVEVRLGERTMSLPDIVRTSLERARRDEGGLDFRYVNLSTFEDQ